MRTTMPSWRRTLTVVLPLVIAIVAISLYTNHQNSRFITFDNFQSIFLQVAVLGIIAIGQTFLIVAGQLDLSVGALAALAGVIGASRIKDGGSELWAVVLVLLICAGVGTLLEMRNASEVNRLNPPSVRMNGGMRRPATSSPHTIPIPAQMNSTSTTAHISEPPSLIRAAPITPASAASAPTDRSS